MVGSEATVGIELDFGVGSDATVGIELEPVTDVRGLLVYRHSGPSGISGSNQSLGQNRLDVLNFFELREINLEYFC